MSNYLPNYVYMNKINIAEARAGFSRYLARVEAGETITLCRRNVPIAELRPIRPGSTDPRPIGIDRGMVVPPAFFDPLPDGILRGFGGEGGGREDGAGDDDDECEGADLRDEVRPGT